MNLQTGYASSLEVTFELISVYWLESSWAPLAVFDSLATLDHGDSTDYGVTRVASMVVTL
jgi:hypothetical protein